MQARIVLIFDDGHLEKPNWNGTLNAKEVNTTHITKFFLKGVEGVASDAVKP
ncbi:MAG: hypothetical protein KC736_03975 [Candidatus Moranbacteria bacterium]|nr:hypothetical protein [Candidatus Moranbacteria bacterium]